ncbi:hypothetical protein SO802_022142 [Lithocarpus litseifolius]|uniref:Cation-transporting P-type ATPase N-terminal domain-containing protein n=1 Tax=Lithocarpus litseifolius TaxID=425828 RepID=A0AAW2CGX5_9ROSI
MASSDSNGMFQHQQPSRNTNNHSPNNHRHRHHDEEAGGGPGSAKFGDYEVSGDPFDIPQAKNASLETLKRWRQMALALNASRRFRYTLDLKREEEKEQRRRMIRSHAQVIRAAVLFKLAGENQIVIGPLATPSTPTGDYGIGLEQLVSITRDHNISALQEYGGVKGVSQLLKTNLEEGITEDETDLIKRKNSFGSNTYPRKKGRSFLRFLWEARQDLTLIILIVAAVVSLALGIKTEGVKEGWYDGGSIAFVVFLFLVIIVTAVSDYRQSLQIQNLNDEKRNMQVEVFRGGRRVQISIFDIVDGDVVLLNIGDQVAADGIVITSHSLAIDESSMTGESKIVHKDQKAPFLMSGCKVADGVGTMLVTVVGINTEWGLLMASISEDAREEMPLQVRLNGVATFIGIVGLSVAVFVLIILLVRYLTGHSKNPDGSTQYVRGVTSASEVVDGVIKIFTVAVTIVVVAVLEGLPLAATLTLAYSMRKMMADKALVRRLSACETMGSATTICSDKTGTLTLNQMENIGSVEGRDGGATPYIDCDFDLTPHIGRTGGTTTVGFAFSQASNSVEGQDASSSGHNGGSGAGSGSDESDQSTGSGGTDTNKGISRRGAGDEHDEDDRDEGNDEDRRRVGELESRTRRVRNSSNMRLVGIFTAIAVQSTSAIIALSLDGLSPLARKPFTGVLVTNLVGFLCLYVALFPSRYISPRAAEILVRVEGASAAFGFLLMMAAKTEKLCSSSAIASDSEAIPFLLFNNRQFKRCYCILKPGVFRRYALISLELLNARTVTQPSKGEELVVEPDGTDEFNPPERSYQDQRDRPLRQANHMSISLTKVMKPFNAANNVPSCYRTSCTDRWKSH